MQCMIWYLQRNCEGNPPVTAGFPSQRANDAESLPTSWCNHTLVMHTPKLLTAACYASSESHCICQIYRLGMVFCFKQSSSVAIENGTACGTSQECTVRALSCSVMVRYRTILSLRYTTVITLKNLEKIYNSISDHLSGCTRRVVERPRWGKEYQRELGPVSI